MTTTAPSSRRGSRLLRVVDSPTSGADVAVADTAPSDSGSPLSACETSPVKLPATEEATPTSQFNGLVKAVFPNTDIEQVEFYREQAILNGDTVNELREELKAVRSLLGRKQREVAEKDRKLALYEKNAALRAAIVEWFIRDSEDLVIELDGEEAFLIHNAWEEPAKYAARYAKFEVAALYGGDLLTFLRRRCPTCGDVDACRYGCGGESTDVVFPKNVINLQAERPVKPEVCQDLQRLRDKAAKKVRRG